MNKLVLNLTGGVPIDSDSLDFMQGNIAMLSNLAVAIGGSFPCIVSGCIVTGSNVSNGIVIINSEPLFFQGGPIGTGVSIIETTTEGTYEDGDSKPISIERIAQFSLTGEVAWADFIRIESLLETNKKLNESLSKIGETFALGGKTIMSGCEVTKTLNDYTHNAGGIFYDGKFYTVDALLTPFNDSGVPKWKIDITSMLANKMKLTVNSDPDGLFVYNSIRAYNEQVLQTTSFFATLTPVNVTLGTTFSEFNYVKQGKNLRLYFRVSANVNTVVNPALNRWVQLKITPPDYFKPKTSSFALGSYYVKFTAAGSATLFTSINTTAGAEFFQGLENSFSAVAGSAAEFYGYLDYIIN